MNNLPSICEIKAQLKKRLSFDRYQHCEAVADMAESLAQKYNCNMEKAYCAGLLHDILREEPKEALLQTANEFGIILSEFEQMCPALWHSIIGAEYVRRHYTQDPDIVNAIRYHTTGRCGMSPLEQVLFVADGISVDRNYAEVTQLREKAAVSLESAIFSMLQSSIIRLAERHLPIHPDTTAAYNTLCVKMFGGYYGKAN